MKKRDAPEVISKKCADKISNNVDERVAKNMKIKK
jgi:hypothetical protein